MNKLLSKPQAKMLTTWVAGLAHPTQDVLVSGLSDDTRTLMAGDAFLCLPRANHVDMLLKQAEEQGAAAVIFVGQTMETSLPSVCLPDMDAVGVLLRRWFDTEHCTMPCIGITGTDGKTSTAWMLREALAKHVGSAWSCGTLGLMKDHDDSFDLGNTTPSLLTLHTLLALAIQEDVGALIFEVSSHGIAQQRIAGIPFTAAIWTTMGRDHLEDHGGFAAYLACKSSFVCGVAKAGGTVVANADYALIQSALSAVDGVHWYSQNDAALTFAAMPMADFHQENLQAIRTLLEASFSLSRQHIIALCDNTISTPIGRLEPVGTQVLIDYAHTAEGLKRCLSSARALTQGRLLLVFGCGGDRDKEKRPLMGQVAATWADQCWLTSDNPRSEPQDAIAQDVLANMSETLKQQIQVCADREKAIQQAVAALTAEDMLVVAGKGHEPYMDIQGERLPWSDKQAVLDALALREVKACV